MQYDDTLGAHVRKKNTLLTRRSEEEKIFCLDKKYKYIFIFHQKKKKKGFTNLHKYKKELKKRKKTILCLCRFVYRCANGKIVAFAQHCNNLFSLHFAFFLSFCFLVFFLNILFYNKFLLVKKR